MTKKRKFNIKYFKKNIDNGKSCLTIVVWGITTMNSFEFLEKLGFSSNEAKVYGTLIKYKVLNGYEIAKLCMACKKSAPEQPLDNRFSFSISLFQKTFRTISSVARETTE